MCRRPSNLYGRSPCVCNYHLLSVRSTDQTTNQASLLSFAVAEPPFPDKKGIQKLVWSELRIDVSKPKQVQRSNWENRTLSQDQIRYAALDAWAGRAVFLVSDTLMRAYSLTHSLTHCPHHRRCRSDSRERMEQGKSSTNQSVMVYDTTPLHFLSFYLQHRYSPLFESRKNSPKQELAASKKVFLYCEDTRDVYVHAWVMLFVSFIW